MFVAKECVALELQLAAALQTGPIIFAFFLEGSDTSVSSKLADEDFAAVPKASFKVVESWMKGVK